MFDLSSKAICVSLRKSQWTGERIDKVVGDKINGDFKTKRNAGRFVKHLLSKDSFKVIQRCAYNVTKFHNKHTSPWEGDQDILASELIPEYQEGMKALVREFDDAADQFAAVYPSLLYSAEQDLGELFHRDEYPLITEVRGRFKVEIKFTPVPVAGDFRVEMANDELEYIKQQLEKDNMVKVAKVTHHGWMRLHEVIRDMVDRMEKSEKFRDTAIKNVVDLVAILPALNISDDPKLEKMRREVEKQICGLDPKELREDETKKKDAIIKAKGIMDKMAGYMGGTGCSTQKQG